MPLFSVIVPAYNATATLRETLDGMLAQDFDDWECVVVDDGSTDDTAALVQEYVERDSRFELIQQQNTGTAGAYRTGIAASAADLLIICAADDYLLPRHLWAMNEFVLQNSDYDIYSCNGEYLYHESQMRRKVYSSPEWQKPRSLSFEQVIQECFFSVGAVFRRRIYEGVGGHRLGVYVDDYDFWLRAMARGARHLYTPAVLSVHRVSDFQQSANLVRVFESNVEVYRHLLQAEDLLPEHRALLESVVARDRNVVEEQTLERQSRDLHRRIENLVGPRFTDVTLRILHTVSWMTIPLRRALARRRSR